MIKKFQEILQEYNLLDEKKSILLAVSGGVDSVVLLDLISKIPESARAEISIAHVNHHLRVESNSEEKFVKELAKEYGFPFYSYQWSKKEHPSSGIENAARSKRYAFFERTMRKHDISYLMTGHHSDDQVETILMRLTRGASLEQLLGIQEKQAFKRAKDQAYLIRPLLEFSKKEIYEYAKKHQLNYIEDQSNQSSDYTRNRFRNEIIPLLKEENARFDDHLKQFRTDLEDLIQIAQIQINQAYKELVQEKNGNFYLNLIKKEEYPKALQKFVINEILKRMYAQGIKQYKTNYIELIDSWLTDGKVNRSIDLTGGYLVVKEYNQAIFKKKRLRSNTIEEKEFKINKLNDWIQLSETEYIALTSEEIAFKNKEVVESDELILTEDELFLPLTVRHRKAGDRMTYKGLKGRKKIKDIFIDDKTSKDDRKKAWLVEDNNQRILWLISHRKRYLLEEVKKNNQFYKLKYKRIGV